MHSKLHTFNVLYSGLIHHLYVCTVCTYACIYCLVDLFTTCMFLCTVCTVRTYVRIYCTVDMHIHYLYVQYVRMYCTHMYVYNIHWIYIAYPLPVCTHIHMCCTVDLSTTCMYCMYCTYVYTLQRTYISTTCMYCTYVVCSNVQWTHPPPPVGYKEV